MPPASNMRKSNAVTTATMMATTPSAISLSASAVDQAAPSRRTTSGRAVRTNTTRPANYYARPYGSFSAASLAQPTDSDISDSAPSGFLPAIQFLGDALTALPREVIRQFTLMKEVEAKIHGPGERLGNMVESLMTEPLLPRKAEANDRALGDAAPGLRQGLLSLTASNSATGSANASVVNGFAPHVSVHSTQNSISGSIGGDEVTHADSELDLARRERYHELRLLTRDMLSNLDEKNVVLAEANRVLSQQLLRVDSVMPHVESEISEEARLGSMTHWAYSDNRQKRHGPAQPTNKRDVAATNSLALAAHAVHENDIAQARKDASREGARERHKGRHREQVGSDFDEKGKKPHAKTARAKAAAPSSTPTGLGISTGEPVKRRKLDKSVVAPGMERSASGTNKGSKGTSKETPRSTPAIEAGRKPSTKARPAPLQKRKGLASANASPAMASSPLHPPTTVSAATVDPITSARPQSARLRQNSLVANARHDKPAEEYVSRPSTASGRNNGEKMNGKRKAPDDARQREDRAAEDIKNTTEVDDEMKQEDADVVERPAVHRSISNSGRAGQGSNAGTPRMENFPEAPGMSRTRSTKSMRGNNGDESSSEPPQGAVGRHRRHQSNSHLIKQLAPFNRSPDLDRHSRDDMDEDLDSVEGERRDRERKRDAEGEEPSSASHSPRKRRPLSRRNTIQAAEPSSPLQPPAPELEQEPLPSPSPSPALSPVPALSPPRAADEELSVPEDDEEEEEEEAGDPDDPNEPKYCYCQRGSYGEMIACDNDDCPREWFHLECTGLTETPGENENWYCDECRTLFEPEGGGGRVRSGRGRVNGGRGR